ncbi:MAG: NAD(P)H-dependent glycerol-3-phosphate dehydrogenase [Actinomycetales bacterium]
MKIAILGTGQWGTALAQVLTDAGNEVIIWGRNQVVVDEINQHHTNNRSLAGVALAESIIATTDIESAFAEVGAIVLALPAQSLRANLNKWREIFPKGVVVISTLKGVELGTHLRMTEIVQEILEIPHEQVAILTGPNLAREVILRQPVGAVAASESQALADATAELFSAPYFRVYTSTDVIGCELAGAAKNVIALAVGMSIGMGFGENTQALVITRGLNELTRLGMARGTKPLTFVGLAGVGDLLATCGSALSRNRTFGEALGRSGSMASAAESVSSTVEGVATASSLVELAHSVGVEVPIMEAVSEVVTNKMTPTEAIIQLMQLHTGAEIEEQ